MSLIEVYGTTVFVHYTVLGLSKPLFRMPTLGMPIVNRLIIRSGMELERPVRVVVVVPVCEVAKTHARLRWFEVSNLFVRHSRISSTGAMSTPILVSAAVAASMLSSARWCRGPPLAL